MRPFTYIVLIRSKVGTPRGGVLGPLGPPPGSAPVLLASLLCNLHGLMRNIEIVPFLLHIFHIPVIPMDGIDLTHYIIPI